MQTLRHGLCFLIFLGFVLVGGRDVAGQETLENLYSAAKKEGEVVMGVGVPAKSLKALESGFNKRFPGVKSRVIASTGSKAISRILMESKAGQPTIEVGQTTTSTIPPMLSAGIVADFNYSEVFGIPKEGILYGNRLIPWFTLVYVLGYNTNLISKQDVPQTWDALLEPKWKGRKIILDGRGHPFQYLVHVWGEDKVKDYVTKLKAQQPIFRPRGGPQIIEALVAGQAPIATAHLNRILLAKQQGAPIDFVWLDYTPLLNFYAYAVNSGAHPAAAKLMAGWLGTSKALKILEDTSLRGLVSQEADTKTAKLFRAAKTEPAWSSVKLEDAKKEKKWQLMARKILVGQ